jgi:hypothetical protein
MATMEQGIVRAMPLSVVLLWKRSGAHTDFLTTLRAYSPTGGFV